VWEPQLDDGEDEMGRVMREGGGVLERCGCWELRVRELGRDV
jgi:hypothetical protein